MMRSADLSPRLVTLCVAALLAGCSFAPHYKTPTTTPAPAYKEATGDWEPAQPADANPRGPWWEMFGDPELNALETKVTASNQNLKIALAQYEEARDLARAAGADYFPQVTGNASAVRTRESHNLPQAVTNRLYNEYTAGASFSYEIDLWGRVRNEVAAAGDRAKASEADLASIDLSLHAELAIDYVSLRADDASQAVLDETVQAYAKALELTQNRFNGGVASETDVDQAQTQFQNAKTQAADIRLKRAQLEHAIAVLTGEAPATFTLPPMPLPLDAKAPVMNPGLPSTLLERRPDIASAERRASAANHDIGVARAAWFPTFSLGGMFGFQSAAASNWFSLPSHFWTLGPQVSGVLLDGGRINALSDEARAAYDEAAANYRQTVLTAYQEVEDNLAALRQLSQENTSQTAAAQAADRALTQEQDRYTGGIVTYLDVVIAQNTALQARLASIDILARQLTASVQLVKALGGGWQGLDNGKKSN